MRQKVFRYPNDSKFGHDSGDDSVLVGWYETEKAEKFDGLQFWKGNTRVSVHTCKPHFYQDLYRTVSGRWILHSWSDYGISPRFEMIDNESAKRWLTLNKNDNAVAIYFDELKEKCGPGRPTKGRRIQIRMPQYVIDKIDKRAIENGTSRAEVIRSICESEFSSTNDGRGGLLVGQGVDHGSD